MLTGEHPFPETLADGAARPAPRDDPSPRSQRLRPDLPHEVDEVIAGRRPRTPTTGSPTSSSSRRRSGRRCEGTRASRGTGREIRNPYKGLRAFLEADAGDFFGREAVTRGSSAAARRARRGRAVPRGRRARPGSGKSSVVRAGLVPALRRGAIPGSERWFVIDVLPGAHPFRELETALLGVAVEPPPSLLDELEARRARPRPRGRTRAPRSRRRAPDRPRPARGALHADRRGRARARSSRACEPPTLDPDGRVRVVATLRADFYDAPLSVRGFGDLLAARTEAITPMSPEELERAIVAPADQAGFVVEPTAAGRDDRRRRRPARGAALLQYALTELAERADGRTLTLDAYRRIGRVSGALARRAEALFEADERRTGATRAGSCSCGS